ncbi:3-dehydroquinate dehydratase [Buchnera aphidicola str. Bp (Baizongia pistaciae)]|uniref:3-dehydroquinate dehydratase n=1 Tax=Buchnera aphidicola subsp. Baizongia pistaciae (strain Bp) TaxID=224915 RepID=AROQ_BUCBP|nr:type II 3-dehydroquinate dehydratase [Buchnera aphidicola]Q89AE0.1 RecName: Full=3-dehydroquinate dehydratase; Short=3-dehydroquinase; AltName: Full=Type II DHQase [Buchnera aphidicola str. Bp (Baizongia pistaciae)]AAO27081.1 3-dehydroquinate dehydratase [Buchnera aphidicola str. Bp (Baizongia pistaciae)]
MKELFNILLINGPNLNLLGHREPKIYGNTTLSQLTHALTKEATTFNIHLHHIQSNSESTLINKIHNSKNNINYIIINAGAFSHTSIALRDALIGINIPFIEVHISNIYTRENFRSHSWLSDISSGVICGLGLDGYFWALRTAIKRIKKISTLQV